MLEFIMGPEFTEASVHAESIVCVNGQTSVLCKDAESAKKFVEAFEGYFGEEKSYYRAVLEDKLVRIYPLSRLFSGFVKLLQLYLKFFLIL